ncbi:MAG: N-acetyl-1-D-myo-inositol-2-amino-2-deoxy-alpha-D-glucopyranoside deacetylase [Mycobacteriales bacterium]
MPPTRRLLLVHAHPDDESILTGGTIAVHRARGDRVAVVTCTRGEQGEVIPPELAHLDADHDDTLGEYRVGELAAALAAAGYPEHHWLGGQGRYRDSGMAGTPSCARSDCFWRADLLDAARDLVPIIREVRPQVLVIENPAGGYRHPDHIQSHRVATYAATLAAVDRYAPELGEPWRIAKTYWNALPRSVIEKGLAAIGGRSHEPFQLARIEQLLRVVDDATVTTEVDATAYAEAKRAAMAAHRTQLTVDGEDGYALSNSLAQPLTAVEHFQLAAGRLGPVGPHGLEADLFAGID